MSVEAPSGSIGSTPTVSFSATEAAPIPAPVASSAPTAESPASREVFSMPHMPPPAPIIDETRVSPIAFRGSTWETVVRVPGQSEATIEPLDKRISLGDVPVQHVDTPNKPGEDKQTVFNPSEWQVVVRAEPPTVVEEEPLLGEVDTVLADEYATDVKEDIASTQENIHTPLVSLDDAQNIGENEVVDIRIDDQERLGSVRDALAAIEEAENVAAGNIGEETGDEEQISNQATDTINGSLVDAEEDMSSVQQIVENTQITDLAEDRIALPKTNQENTISRSNTVEDVIRFDEVAQTLIQRMENVGMDEEGVTAIVTTVVEDQGMASYRENPVEALTVVEQRVDVFEQQKTSDVLLTESGESVVIRNAPHVVDAAVQAEILSDLEDETVEQAKNIPKSQLAEITIQNAPSSEVAEQILGEKEKIVTAEEEQEEERSYTFVEDTRAQKVRGAFVASARKIVEHGTTQSLIGLGRNIIESVHMTKEFVSQIVERKVGFGRPEDVDGSLQHVLRDISKIKKVDEIGRIPAILKEHKPVAVEEEPAISPGVNNNDIEKVILDTSVFLSIGSSR